MNRRKFLKLAGIGAAACMTAPISIADPGEAKQDLMARSKRTGYIVRCRDHESLRSFLEEFPHFERIGSQLEL
jgi:hypothetical protein